MADLILTDEVKEQLKKAGMLGFTVEAAFPYVPSFYRKSDKIPRELWPVYTLRSKNGVEVANIEDRTGAYQYEDGKPVFKIMSGTNRLDTLRNGILKIKNQMMEDGSRFDFDAKTGEMVSYKLDGSTEKKHTTLNKILEYLTPVIQVDLQNAINERTLLTAEELQGLPL